MDTKTERSTIGYSGLIASLALVVAFLGANPFADAVGIPREDVHRTSTPIILRFVCGLVVLYATFSVLRFLVGHVRAAVRGLVGSEARPDRGLTLAILICGTLCVLAALYVQIYASAHPNGGRVGPTMSFNAGGPGGSLNMEAHPEGSLALNLLSVLTFLAGAGLLAFGIWGSLKRPSNPPALPASLANPEGWGEATIDAARV